MDHTIEPLSLAPADALRSSDLSGLGPNKVCAHRALQHGPVHRSVAGQPLGPEGGSEGGGLLGPVWPYARRLLSWGQGRGMSGMPSTCNTVLQGSLPGSILARTTLTAAVP